MQDELTSGTSLRIPLQGAGVERSPSRAAFGGDGVEAAGWFDDLTSGIGSALGVAQQVAPYVGTLASFL
jgi:hypothetical protein